jgi:hypothetical protein
MSPFSGVMESDRSDLIDRALEAQHGPVMSQLKELERGIEIAESAVETGRDEVRQETGLSPEIFNERAAPFEPKGKAHWIRKCLTQRTGLSASCPIGTHTAKSWTESAAGTTPAGFGQKYRSAECTPAFA